MELLNLIWKGLGEIYKTYNKRDDITIYLTPWQFNEIRMASHYTTSVEYGYSVPNGGTRIFGYEVKVETREDNSDAIRLEFQLYNGRPPVVHYVR